MVLLIVDDNERMRLILRRVVKELTETVYECENGAQALAAYETHYPDCILMDVEMPEMDGFAATEQIKSLHPEARILIITDYNDEETREAALLAGAEGFVGKDNLLELPAFISRNPH